MPDSDRPPPGHFRYRESDREVEERQAREAREPIEPPPFGLDGGVANPGLGGEPEREYQRPYPYPYHPPWEIPPGGGPDIELYDLIDFTVQVGNTGINFVAGLTGWRESDGTALFLPGACEAAYRRAASTLAFMALVSGQTFQFLRTAQNLTVDQAAAICGVTSIQIENWEFGTVPVIITAWQTLADMACKADQRAGISCTPIQPSFRPRTIRIYPDVPYKNVQPAPCGPCDPCR